LPFDESQPRCPLCKGEMEQMLKPLVKNGKIVAKLPKANEIRQYVLKQLAKLVLEEKL
jgi:nicotinate phosphoribosyltransferase